MNCKNKISLRAPAHLRSGEGIVPSDLKNKAEADPSGFAALVRGFAAGAKDLAESGRLSDEVRSVGVTEADAQAFSFRTIGSERFKELRRQLQDVDVTIPEAVGSARTITTGAFPLLTSALAVAGVNEAYMDVPTIGEQLVTEVDVNKKESTFAGILNYSKEKLERENESAEYAHVGSGSEQFSIKAKDLGMQTAISQNLIDQADTVAIADRLTNLGRLARMELEDHTLRRVTDNAGSAGTPAVPYVLKGPSVATGTSFFVTSNAAPLTRLPSSGNRITSNPLSDLANVEAARARFAEFTDAAGHRIAFDPSEIVILVPDALLFRAWTLLNSAGAPGVFNEANFFGPAGAMRPQLLSSPKLDALSSTAWYFGIPRRVFKRTWLLRPEVSTHGGNGTMPYTTTREGLRVRVAWQCEIGASDYVGWLQCLEGSTAPTNAGGY